MTKNSDGIIKSQKTIDKIVVIELAGEIEMNCAMQLREAISDAMGDGSTVVLNMAAVDFMDSSGLATLVEALQRSRKEGKRLKLSGMNKRVKSIFEISRLESIFDIYETEEEAIA